MRPVWSLPPREAWIEIVRKMEQDGILRSLPPREAWIEIVFLGVEYIFRWSLPPREAWIEIDSSRFSMSGHIVASPAGSVD